MTARHEERDREAREAEATEWLCERAAGFTAERAETFARWLAADARNRAAMKAVERTLELLDQLPEARAPLEARYGRTDEIGMTRAEETRRFGIRRWFRLAGAMGLAALLVLAVLGGWSWQRARNADRFATPTSAQQRVALRDGSVVDLNEASEVRVQFSAAQRSVTLETGEAHFEVAHDPARPFVVTAGAVTVRAIGTAFNVRRAGDSVDVVVTEGKVEVVRDSAAPLAPARISAGERLRVETNEDTAAPIERVEPTTMRALLAWQDRITNFSDVPLRELVARFNRRNTTKLVLEGAELGERKLGGVFALDQVEVFVRLLEQEGEIISERRGAAEIVLRPAR